MNFFLSNKLFFYFSCFALFFFRAATLSRSERRLSFSRRWCPFEWMLNTRTTDWQKRREVKGKESNLDIEEEEQNRRRMLLSENYLLTREWSRRMWLYQCSSLSLSIPMSLIDYFAKLKTITTLHSFTHTRLHLFNFSGDISSHISFSSIPRHHNTVLCATHMACLCV